MFLLIQLSIVIWVTLRPPFFCFSLAFIDAELYPEVKPLEKRQINIPLQFIRAIVHTLGLSVQRDSADGVVYIVMPLKMN